MNFSMLNVALFGVGALLIAAAIKDQTPRQIIEDAISQGGAKSDEKRNAGGLSDADLDSPTVDEGQRGAYGNDGTTPLTPMAPVNYKIASV